MTVSELIEELKKYPEDTLVYIPYSEGMVFEHINKISSSKDEEEGGVYLK